METQHTDIARHRWIERLPSRIRPFFYLARIDRPIGIWLLLLPGWWGIILAVGGARGIDARTFELLILFAIGAIVMRAAGCVVNDLWDRDLDRKVARTRGRPLASGAVGMKSAFAFLAALLVAGFLILIQMPLVTILLGVLSLPLIAVYPLMKRITWWPQLFLGVTFNFGALMGWSAVTGTVGLAALCLYVAGIFWTLGYDTIYAHQDIEDDALAGIKSTARLFAERGKFWVVVFHGLTILFLCAAGVVAEAGTLYFLILAAASVFALRSCLHWNPSDPASSLKVFRLARDFGVLIFIAALFS